MSKNRMSLDDLIETKNSHCFGYIKDVDGKLEAETCDKIKTTIVNRLHRSLTNDEYKVFKIFTGMKKLTQIGDIHLSFGSIKFGMFHILYRHFRENGDKNGGRVEYIDIILIPTILETIKPVYDAKEKKYTYTYTHEIEKVFILIVKEFSKKKFVHTFYSKDSL